MTTSARFTLGHVLVALATAIAVYWVSQLYPFWTHTGPPPGAGDQYIFLLLPTTAVACAASLTGTFLMLPPLARDPGTRSPLRLVTTAVGALTSLGVCGFWVHIGIHVLGG